MKARPSPPLFAGVALVLLSGCDRGWGATGAVTAGEPAVPVAGALVAIRCVERYGDSTVTDKKGMYSLGRLGALSDDCRLEVEAEGFQRFVVPAHEVCDDLDSDMCWLIRLDIVLQAEP
jgi:hypothetical protein